MVVHSEQLRKLRHNEQTIHRYPASSKWYINLNTAINCLEVAEKASSAKEKFTPVWDAFRSLFTMLRSGREKESELFSKWIIHVGKLPEIQIKALGCPTPLLKSIIEEKEIFLRNEERQDWRPSFSMVQEWLEKRERNREIDSEKSCKYAFYMMRDVRNACQHSRLDPRSHKVRKVFREADDYFIKLLVAVIRATIESAPTGTVGKNTAQRPYLYPFMKNSDSLFSEYYLQKMFSEQHLQNINRNQELAKLQKISRQWEKNRENLVQANQQETQAWCQENLFTTLRLDVQPGCQITAEDIFSPTYCVAKDTIQKNYLGKDAGEHLSCLIWVLSWGKDLDSICEEPNFEHLTVMEMAQRALSISNVTWAILTNGYQIRLLNKNTSHKPRCFLEFDLAMLWDCPEQQDAQEAWLFCLTLFSTSAFEEKGVLNQVVNGSEKHGKEIGDELKKNVYGALTELGDGFLQFFRDNPEQQDSWADKKGLALSSQDGWQHPQLLQEIYQESLALMYRLLFLFYAESRQLLPVEEEFYYDGYSLEKMRNEIAENTDSQSSETYSRGSFSLWQRLQELFQLVNDGIEDMVPAYNGGLFDPEQHDFLHSYKVSDFYLTTAIDLLSRTRPSSYGGRKKVTYRDLDVRHLGSIYEGILEYSAHIAPQDLVVVREKKEEVYKKFSELSAREKEHYQKWKNFHEDSENSNLKGCKVTGEKKQGQYYLVCGGQDSQRKTSGSYYTPEYIVQYIIESTLGPIIEGKCRPKSKTFKGKSSELLPPPEEPLQGPLSSEEILDLKVLDPAMGSGHFLVSAIDYLAKAYGKALLREGKYPEKSESEELFIRHKRLIAERCIYGVDINPMAVELGKLSIWLLTMDPQCPLSFLNHHLKCGNSLVGVKSRDICENDLFDFQFKPKLKIIIGKVLEILLKETRTHEDIETKKIIDKTIEATRRPFRNLTDILEAKYFGDDEHDFNDYLSNIQQAKKIKCTTAKKYLFFHWPIEFPEIWYDKHGNPPEYSGFDVIIGNPPYVRQESLGELKECYLKKKYDVYHGVADLYTYFLERAMLLLRPQGMMSMIISNKWLKANYGQPLREWLKKKQICEIVDFGDLPVFPKVTAYPCILTVCNDKAQASFPAVEVENLKFENLADYTKNQIHRKSVQQSSLKKRGWSLVDKKVQKILDKIENVGIPLGKYVEGKIYRGVLTGLNKAFVIDSATREELIDRDSKCEELIKPFLFGREIKRYQPIKAENYVIFTRRGIDIRQYPVIEEYLEKFKDQLMPKSKDGKDKKGSGRKPGEYKWYEIQDTIDYYKEFDKPKIIWPGISKEVTAFTFDEKNLYGNDNNHFIVTKNLSLLGILNSKLSRFFLKNTCDKVRGGYYRLKIAYVKRIPIYLAENIVLENLIEEIILLNEQYSTCTKNQSTDLYHQILSLDRKIDTFVYQLYNLAKEEIQIIEQEIK